MANLFLKYLYKFVRMVQELLLNQSFLDKENNAIRIIY